jgi:hypothetical protein
MLIEYRVGDQLAVFHCATGIARQGQCRQRQSRCQYDFISLTARALASRDEKVENVAVEDGELDDSSNMQL